MDSNKNVFALSQQRTRAKPNLVQQSSLSGTSVQLEGISKIYRLGSVPVSALRGVDLEVKSGEFLALAGPSGSGKTTLLNIIGCLESPSAGQVIINGVDASRLTDDQLADLRLRQIGFIFQNFNLLPVLTASENVQYPLALRRGQHSATERRMLAEEALETLGLLRFRDHRPAQLSGGQRQRVAIARALVTGPKLILADEPTANLDRQTGEKILSFMKRINVDRKTTFVFSTHDPNVIKLADRVIRVADGLVVPA